MTDIVDTIDALIDEQLDAGEPIGGYDYDDPDYPSCWHCGRDWHGMRITTRIEQMRWWGAVDEDYRYSEDDSEVVCPGPDFIGPWADHYQLQRIRSVWQLPHDAFNPSGWRSIGTLQVQDGAPYVIGRSDALGDRFDFHPSDVTMRFHSAMEGINDTIRAILGWPNLLEYSVPQRWVLGGSPTPDPMYPAEYQFPPSPWRRWAREQSTPLVNKLTAPDVDAVAGGAAARLAQQSPNAPTGTITGATVPTTVDPPAIDTTTATTATTTPRRPRVASRQETPMWVVDPARTRRTRNGARDVRTPLA